MDSYMIADILGTTFGLMGVLMVYLIPSFVAFMRYHNRFGTILGINLVFGWTIVGWLGTLSWAFSSNTTHPDDTIEINDLLTGAKQTYHTRPLK